MKNQLDLFSANPSDLPLFSGTAQPAHDETYRPQEQPQEKQLDMFNGKCELCVAENHRHQMKATVETVTVELPARTVYLCDGHYRTQHTEYIYLTDL